MPGRTSELYRFRRIIHLIKMCMPVADVLEEIIRAVEDDVPAMTCGVYLLDPQTQMLRLAAAPAMPPQYRQAVAEVPVSADFGCSARAVFRNERVIAEDILTDPGWSPIRDLVESTGFRACWAEPIRDSRGDVLGAFAFFRDVVGGPSDDVVAFMEAAAELAGVAVARVMARVKLDAANEAAESANRAKADFLTNMSHEIRTPLNGVIGVAAALSQTELTPAQREMVALIERSGVTLERLVSDVLDVSKTEAGLLDIEMREMDLQAELEPVLDVFRLKAQEKALRFAVTYGARGRFLGDGLRVRQVLSNLLSNAVKFTDRGEVRVSIDLAEASGAGQPGMLALEVADTGAGFDAAFADQMFQRFSQADTTVTRRFGGMGLGLSITHALVELMGGRISARSEPGRGSTFRVELPLERTVPLADYDAGAAHEAEGHGAPAAVALQGLRVLLAEDHPINQRVVQLILEPLGVQLTTVDNGRLAVDAFAVQVFDLVLMDMQMPEMDGVAATRALRELEARHPERPRAAIIMLSANAMCHHRQDSKAAGADLHAPKPIAAAGLVEAVFEVLQARVAADVAVSA